MSGFKFIHCSDLHLDVPFAGILSSNDEIGKILRDAPLKSYFNIVEQAIRERVNFVVIAGDVFNSSDKSIRAQFYFYRGLKKLSDNGIPVFIAHGNHDPLNCWSKKMKLPENAFVFGSEKASSHAVTVDGDLIARVYGISYETRDTTENLSLKFKREDELPAIAVLHCNVGENTGHESYAPTSVSDILARGFDYWALGHVHNYNIIRKENPAIVYPGNIQAVKSSEHGPKGYCLVEYTRRSGFTIDFRPIDLARYESLRIDISSCEAIEDIPDEINEQIEELIQKSDNRHLIVSLDVYGKTALNAELRRREFVQNILEDLRDQFVDREPALWVDKILLSTAIEYDIGAIRMEKSFASDVISAYDSIHSGDPDFMSLIRNELNLLYKDWPGSTFLETLTDEDIKKLSITARDRTLEKILSGD
ncbi:MAG: DNA repair exonuclease [Candidatus Zixiibacteriota bacterium]